MTDSNGSPNPLDGFVAALKDFAAAARSSDTTIAVTGGGRSNGSTITASINGNFPAQGAWEVVVGIEITGWESLTPQPGSAMAKLLNILVDGKKELTIVEAECGGNKELQKLLAVLAQLPCQEKPDQKMVAAFVAQLQGATAAAAAEESAAVEPVERAPATAAPPAPAPAATSAPTRAAVVLTRNGKKPGPPPDPAKVAAFAAARRGDAKPIDPAKAAGMADYLARKRAERVGKRGNPK